MIKIFFLINFIFYSQFIFCMPGFSLDDDIFGTSDEESKEIENESDLKLSFSLLHYYILNDRIDLFKGHINIYENLNLDVTDKFGQTVLHLACAKGFIDVVKILIENGASLDIVDKKGYSPLRLALVNEHSGIVKFLIKAGCSVAEQDLILAISNSQFYFIKLMRVKDYKLVDSCFRAAIKEGDVSTVELFIENEVLINEICLLKASILYKRDLGTYMSLARTRILSLLITFYKKQGGFYFASNLW
ncbi:MAG: ankyrin repeat domain-containing protein [bacterium]